MTAVPPAPVELLVTQKKVEARASVGHFLRGQWLSM
jgi:hypothetical protein